ncbi:MAG: DUF4176 domain-containing protein [Eubacterium sp.]|nr:DUF4176 domain-containing protein [Eubacterium sp.]
MKNAKDLMPIGSVVRLKEAEKKLMIIGIKQLNEEKGTVKDYIGVMYPEGYLNKEVFFTFDQEDVEETIFEGYRSKEQETFFEQVSEVLDQ